MQASNPDEGNKSKGLSGKSLADIPGNRKSPQFSRRVASEMLLITALPPLWDHIGRGTYGGRHQEKTAPFLTTLLSC